jgi:hypothetical protein
LRQSVAWTPERRAKLSVALQGKKRPPETRAKISAALKGRPLSPEHRAKISAARRTPETRAKISAAAKEQWARKTNSCSIRPDNGFKGGPVSKFHSGDREVLRFQRHSRRRGKPLSREHRAKLSAAHKGKSKSPEHRAKLSASKSGENHPFFGKALSPEHRAKISAAHIGKQRSLEIRTKISAAAKEREARKRLLQSAPTPAPDQATQSVFRQ